jgi:hypothetical protein
LDGELTHRFYVEDGSPDVPSEEKTGADNFVGNENASGLESWIVANNVNYFALPQPRNSNVNSKSK